MKKNEKWTKDGELVFSEDVPYTKAELRVYLDAEYKKRITAPINLHDITIVPDDNTLNRLNNKIQAMRKRDNPSETTRWIGTDGPVDLTLSQLEDIGLEADDQWQSYFDALPSIISDIQAGNITDKDGVDAALDGIDF